MSEYMIYNFELFGFDMKMQYHEQSFIMGGQQGGTRPIYSDKTKTEKLDLSKLTTRPRPRNKGS